METSNNQAIFQATLPLSSSALIVALVNETIFTLESLQRNATKYYFKQQENIIKLSHLNHSFTTQMLKTKIKIGFRKTWWERFFKIRYNP